MSTARPWAWPLVPLYAGVLAAKARLRSAGLLPSRQLGWPVVSVGSVSAGGAGKTPVAMALAQMLGARGWQVDLLSRGYGRTGRGVERVSVDGQSAGPDALAKAARQFGDEPVVLARGTGAPVWVGASRWAAGTAAEAGSTEARRGVHLLDDGFQHRALARSFDLVLVTAADLSDVLLPAGNLREPLAALGRAHALGVREDEAEAVGPKLRPLLREGTPVWTIRRTLHFPPPLGIFGAGLRPLALCALARPADFVSSLRRAGCGVVDAVVFPDHHGYGMSDAKAITDYARSLQATGLVTTEKDRVKLPDALVERLEGEIGPIVTVELRAEFVYKSPVLRAIEDRLKVTLGRREEHEAHAR